MFLLPSLWWEFLTINVSLLCMYMLRVFQVRLLRKRSRIQSPLKRNLKDLITTENKRGVNNFSGSDFSFIYTGQIHWKLMDRSSEYNWFTISGSLLEDSSPPLLPHLFPTAKCHLFNENSSVYLQHEKYNIRKRSRKKTKNFPIVISLQ